MGGWVGPFIWGGWLLPLGVTHLSSPHHPHKRPHHPPHPPSPPTQQVAPQLGITEAELEACRAEAKAQVKAAVEFADASPPPPAGLGKCVLTCMFCTCYVCTCLKLFFVSCFSRPTHHHPYHHTHTHHHQQPFTPPSLPSPYNPTAKQLEYPDAPSTDYNTRDVPADFASITTKTVEPKARGKTCGWMRCFLCFFFKNVHSTQWVGVE